MCGRTAAFEDIEAAALSTLPDKVSLNTLTVEDEDSILQETDWMLLLPDMISLSQLGDSSLESTLDARSTFNGSLGCVGDVRQPTPVRSECTGADGARPATCRALMHSGH